MPHRSELPQQDGERIAPRFPHPTHHGGRGRPWEDHRRTLNGILWRLHTGAPWRDIPQRYGPWQASPAFSNPRVRCEGLSGSVSRARGSHRAKSEGLGTVSPPAQPSVVAGVAPEKPSQCARQGAEPLEIPAAQPKGRGIDHQPAGCATVRPAL
jgi:transposase